MAVSAEPPFAHLYMSLRRSGQGILCPHFPLLQITVRTKPEIEEKPRDEQQLDKKIELGLLKYWMKQS
jgi:hypothetical protein